MGFEGLPVEFGVIFKKILGHFLRFLGYLGVFSLILCHFSGFLGCFFQILGHLSLISAAEDEQAQTLFFMGFSPKEHQKQENSTNSKFFFWVFFSDL